MFTWVVAVALAVSGSTPAGPDAATQLMTLPPALQAQLNDTILVGHLSQPQRLQRLVHFVFDPEGLGVTLAREQIKHIPHPGVTFRPITPSVRAEYWIAWNRDNASSALRDYVQIVKALSSNSA